MVADFTKRVCLAIALTASVTNTAWPDRAFAGGHTALVQVLWDDTATLQNSGPAEQAQMTLLGELVRYRRTGLRDAPIDFISVNRGQNILRTSPRLLFQDAQTALEALKPRPDGCSDIVAALEQARLNLEQSHANEVYLFSFGSLISSGVPCENVSIELPQAVPEGFDLSFLAERDATVRFYWVSPYQVRPYLEAVSQFGLQDVQLFDEVRTPVELRKGLPHD